MTSIDQQKIDDSPKHKNEFAVSQKFVELGNRVNATKTFEKPKNMNHFADFAKFLENDKTKVDNIQISIGNGSLLNERLVVI